MIKIYVQILSFNWLCVKMCTRILCAAIHFNDGKKYQHQPKNIEYGYVICGRRHHNILSIIFELGIKFDKKNIVQGFITSDDMFLTREEAAMVAFNARQTPTCVKSLISEHLY